MLRVAVALLLAAAALAAVDLSGLVDVVYNTSSPLEHYTPTYVFEVNGCRALVYVSNSPLNKYDEVYYSRNTAVRPLTSAEVEKLLDALFQALGSSAEVIVIVRERGPLWYKALRLEARNVSQLAEEARRALGAGFYLGAADAQKALEGGAEQAAFPYQVEWRRGDVATSFYQSHSSARLVVKADNLSAAVKALEKAREAMGELWNSVEVELWHGPYLVPGDDVFTEALRNATLELERELGTRGGRVWARGAEGVIFVFSIGEVGPLYVVFPYSNDTAPDRTTAERLVRRFVELSGFCKSPLVVEFWQLSSFRKSPLVVEFWPKTRYELPLVEASIDYSPPPSPGATTTDERAVATDAVAVGAIIVAVVAVSLLVSTRRRK